MLPTFEFLSSCSSENDLQFHFKPEISIMPRRRMAFDKTEENTKPKQRSTFYLNCFLPFQLR